MLTHAQVGAAGGSKMGEKAPPAEQGREPSKCELRSSVAYVTAMPDRVPHAIVEWYNAVPSGNVVWRP